MYAGGFCFHTAKTSFLLPLDEAKRGLAMLAEAGMRKINFSGGEPFLIQGGEELAWGDTITITSTVSSIYWCVTGRYLGEMVRFCKEELDIESVTVVTNGSRTTETWMAEYGYYLDIMAVSVDSFVPEVSCRYLHNVSIISTEVNAAIGRRAGPGSDHLASLGRVRGWCRQYGVLFKVGTEISSNI